MVALWGARRAPQACIHRRPQRPCTQKGGRCTTAHVHPCAPTPDVGAAPAVTAHASAAAPRHMEMSGARCLSAHAWLIGSVHCRLSALWVAGRPPMVVVQLLFVCCGGDHHAASLHAGAWYQATDVGSGGGDGNDDDRPKRERHGSFRPGSSSASPAGSLPVGKDCFIGVQFSHPTCTYTSWRCCPFWHDFAMMLSAGMVPGASACTCTRRDGGQGGTEPDAGNKVAAAPNGGGTALPSAASLGLNPEGRGNL